VLGVFGFCFIISLEGFGDSRAKRTHRGSLITSILLVVIVFAYIRASLMARDSAVNC
jgi:hypothetical protein